MSFSIQIPQSLLLNTISIQKHLPSQWNITEVKNKQSKTLWLSGYVSLDILKTLKKFVSSKSNVSLSIKKNHKKYHFTVGESFYKEFLCIYLEK